VCAVFLGQMKKFGLDPEDPTYTALFNACSNSPWPADGVQRAVKLRHLMLEKGYSPNMMTYNAMIKAYAKCGDVQKAFAVVDEAIAAGHKPRAPCFCFILMACIADKERGMKLAIEVRMWDGSVE
jgi:pentatricopeptide repeat domain-containing protein 1